MSFQIKRENLDKENKHVVLPSKEQLRPQSSENAVVPQKRALAPKTTEKRFRRVPLGGKDQNSAPYASLQRSLSSIPQKLASKPAPLPSSWQPTLGRSNSTLGFSHTKPALAETKPGLAETKPVLEAARKEPLQKAGSQRQKTNPHKNELLGADGAARSKALVPRFSADSLEKPPAKAMGPAPVLQIAAAPQLHASKLPPQQRTKEPSKKGIVQMDEIIESLAEDENSVETVPEKPAPLRDSPVGISPLSGARFRFLEPEAKAPLAAAFDSSIEMSLDDLVDERESTRIDSHGGLEQELQSAGPLGLSEQELNDLLDY